MFDPADAIDPTRRRLPWLYEHAKRWWSVRAWLATMAMLLWPPAFWKRVRPEHGVRVGRIIGMVVWPYMFVVLATLLVTFVESCTFGRQRHHYNNYSAQASWSDSIQRGFESYVDWLFNDDSVHYLAQMAPFADGFLPLLIFWLPVAGAFLAIPSEWSGTPLRRSHFVRLLGYASAPYLLPPPLGGVWNLGIQLYQAVYSLQPYNLQRAWPDPDRIFTLYDVDFVAMWVAFTLWGAFYWFSAIRWGYSLPSTKRPFCIVLAVLLTPWALFLAFEAYYAFID